MQIVTRDFNTCHHWYKPNPHRSTIKRVLKRRAHHRVRAALRSAFAHHDWELAHNPTPIRPASGWDII